MNILFPNQNKEIDQIKVIAFLINDIFNIIDIIKEIKGRFFIWINKFNQIIKSKWEVLI